jgi:uncharacterized protein
MTARYRDLLFSPTVQAVQEAMGSRGAYGRDPAAEGPDLLTDQEAAFIAARDSFYLASVGHGGWPYIQHRGGPPGFVKVIEPGLLAFADFRGNRQYISVGNLAGDDRVALFFMDYANRARLKLLGRMRVEDAEGGLRAAVADETYRGRIERILTVRVEAFDWNCPQHITPRYTAGDIAPLVQRMQARIDALEAALAERDAAVPDTA